MLFPSDKGLLGEPCSIRENLCFNGSIFEFIMVGEKLEKLWDPITQLHNVLALLMMVSVLRILLLLCWILFITRITYIEEHLNPN